RRHAGGHARVQPRRPGRAQERTRLGIAPTRDESSGCGSARRLDPYGTKRFTGSDEPLNRSRSTGTLIPGTEPWLECCQKVHPAPPQPTAGTVGWLAVVQFAIHRTE